MNCNHCGDYGDSVAHAEECPEIAARARLAAIGIDATAELATLTASLLAREVAAIGPMGSSEIASLREWLASWPLGADIVPMPRVTVARLLDAAQHAKDATP